MTTPLYAIAAVGIGVAGFCAYQKVEMHEQKLADTKTLEVQSKKIEAVNAVKQKQYDPMKAENDRLKAALSELNAEVDLKDGESVQLTSQVSQLEDKVVAKKAELQGVKDALAEVEEAFAAHDVPITGIPDYLKQLEEEQEALVSESEELATISEATSAKLDVSKGLLNDYKRREVERARNLNQNGISSLITAVNSDWGFVVITPHPGAVITTDSNLIIVRGGQLLGRLKINAVETNRVIADIDFDSLVAGSRVRAGDRVILAKTNTH